MSGRWLITIAGTLAVLLAAGLVGRVRVVHVTSDSMAPTYGVGSHLVTTAWGATDAERGDVVVFAAPRAWRDAARESAGRSAHPDVQDRMVKRVIATGGDSVECCTTRGDLILNGEPLTEPYLRDDPRQGNNPTFRVTVPAGHLWMMGDNRGSSFDSRAMHARGDDGFVPRESVEGRILLHR